MDKAVIKGLRLIEALAMGEAARGVSDLAQELQLTKSNVHRLLTTLQAQGYVRQNPGDSSYQLTMKLWELGARVPRRMDLLHLARPAMRRLADQTGETVHLSVLEDVHVIYVDKIESAHHLRAHTAVGSRAPAFAVATGKAMLAQLPDSALERFVPHLQRYTPSTRATLDELREDIALARQQGFATVVEGEWRVGIAACACAILGARGELVGAIGMSGPDSRIKRKQLKVIAPQVVAAAQQISAALGHLPPG